MKFRLGDYILRFFTRGYGGTLARVEDIISHDSDGTIYLVYILNSDREVLWTVGEDDEDYTRVVLSFVGPVRV